MVWNGIEEDKRRVEIYVEVPRSRAESGIGTQVEHKCVNLVERMRVDTETENLNTKGRYNVNMLMNK